jgi:hypothetical protein
LCATTRLTGEREDVMKVIKGSMAEKAGSKCEPDVERIVKKYEKDRDPLLKPFGDTKR